jgi:hypothetical protein
MQKHAPVKLQEKQTAAPGSDPALKTPRKQRFVLNFGIFVYQS